MEDHHHPAGELQLSWSGYCIFAAGRDCEDTNVEDLEIALEGVGTGTRDC